MATLDPRHAGQPVAPELAEFTRRMALELAGEAPELPSFPEVALRVRRALSQEDIAVDEVVRIVSAEPSLAVRLLQLANSVAQNPGMQRVTTLRTAITRLGFNLARSATIAFAMSQMRRATSWRGLEARFREIWESSARLAAVSHAIARHARREDADQALLAGMLHAIGRLFVLTRLGAWPVLCGGAMYDEIERDWHARAGRALLARWDLDEDIIAAACDFEQAHAQRAGRATLSDVLLAGHYLAGVRDETDVATAEFLGTAPFKRLRLDAAHLAAVLESSAAEIAALRAALGDQPRL
ncbi:MAG TPA: HDOD domain-containing protein [Steroidobacteraceae bacterium]|nr:HDOD domain-containing protein [Steroidobacteraceae bacterium]